MAKKKITELVTEELNAFLPEKSLELYNAEFIKEGRDWFLRVYIDKPESMGEAYVSTDDCELVSRFLSERLDELDPIEQNYYLEVSSPGMDRALLKDDDFRRYAGREVEISLYKAWEGKKKHRGVLQGLAGGMIVIADETGKQIEIPREQVSKTCLAVIF